MTAYRILFVEDDFMALACTREFLEDRGFIVEAASSAEAAFEVIRRGAHLSALLTDVDLGHGPDGFEVARQVRAAYPGLPVIFVSGTAQARHATEGVEGSQFIPKPYQPDQIVHALVGSALMAAA